MTSVLTGRPSGPVGDDTTDAGQEWVLSVGLHHHSLAVGSVALRPVRSPLTPACVAALPAVVSGRKAPHVVLDLRDVDLDPDAVDALVAVDVWLRTQAAVPLTLRVNKAAHLAAFESMFRVLIG
jgi:hypothetical protein